MLIVLRLNRRFAFRYTPEVPSGHYRDGKTENCSQDEGQNVCDLGNMVSPFLLKVLG